MVAAKWSVGEQCRAHEFTGIFHIHSKNDNGAYQNHLRRMLLTITGSMLRISYLEIRGAAMLRDL